MANYIGKIAAVVTANVSDVAPKLSASAREWNKYGKSVQASIDAARRNARSSFDQIFTAQQRLERAFAASRNTTLRINTREGEDAIRRLIGAADELARPLVSAQKQFSSLSSSIQNEFGRALSEAQNAARSAAAAINETGRLGEQSFERYKRRVDEAAASLRRLSEADAAVGGLATGRELRFQQAGFAAELQRTSALQSQASALPADARASGAVAQLVELQRREAEEAARLLAVLENVRNTRRGDAAAAQANLDAQIQRQRLVNDQLERQISLSNAAKQARSVRDRASASETRAGGGFASLEEAQRGADGLFSRIERLGPQAFRSLAGEIDGLASAFATGFIGPVNDDFQRLLSRVRELESETRKFTLVQQRPRSEGLGLFGSQVGLDEERAIARARRVSAEFAQLPESAQAGLQGLAGIASRVADGVDAGTSNATQLLAVLDRLEPAVAAASQFRPIQGNATGQFGPTLEDSPESLRRREAENQLGLNVTEQQRGLAGLRASVSSVADQAERLPAAVRGRFIPALRDAQQEYVRLFSSGTATVDQIDRAAARVRNLETQIGRASRAAQQFGGSFREFADNADIQGAAGRLQFLRQQLLRATGDTARAEAAADNLAAVFQRAASTPGGFRAISAELNQVEREAVEAAAAVLRIRPNRLAEQLKRAGDVSRGAFGNTGLAVQQAIFAFDDFFSVTGDLSQRIRAAGNNISQLGFIIGGTAGLITGVALSAFSQVAVALINWANSGRTAEDQTKALNDALSRQKSLAEELAQAFSSLGDSIARRAFSAPAQEARAFRRELEDIVRKQKELRDQRSLGLDERVLTARADVTVAERKLGRATTRDQAVAAQRRLDEARSRLAAEESRVRNRPDVTLGQATARAQAVFDQATARASLQAQANAAVGGPGAVAVARDAAVNAGNAIRDRVLAGLRGVNDPARARQVLADAQARAAERGDTRLAGQLEELINSLDAPIRRAADDFAARLFRSASTAAQQIELAQDNIAKAIQSGVPGALSIRRSLDRAAEEIDAAQSAISSAQRDFAESGQTRADADVRDERLRDADRRLQRARRDREAAITQARDADTQRIVDPQSTLEARRSRVEQNLQQSGVAEGFFARRLRQLEAQRSQLIADAEADPGNVFAQRRAERGGAAIDEEIRALEAATLALRTFADGLNRAAQVVQSDLDASRQDAASARRRDLGVSTPQSRREREARAADFRDQQDAARRAQRDIDIARGRLEDEVKARGLALGVNDPFARIAVINEQLQSGAVVGKERDDLIAERDRLLAAIQPLADAFNLAAEEITASAERLREVSLLAAEGRELSLTPAERAGEQLDRQLEAVRLAFATEAERTTGLIDQAGQREAQQRVLADNIRQVAPLRAQFTEEVANAVLQGPSRAALQASDATTVEGNRELSRLLRGDDTARDVNLIELQRQTQALEELLRIAREQGVLIAE